MVEMPQKKPRQQIAPFDDDKINDLLMWSKRPTANKIGKMAPNSLNNILIFMRHKQKYMGIFRYDRFSNRIILHREPFWHSEGIFKIRQLSDADVTYVTAALEREGLSPSSLKVLEAIHVSAKENWIDPPFDYFNRITWDGTTRLNEWLQTYLGATGEPEYLSTIGRAWLVAGVARIYSPGCRADNMIVLEGPQGALKSTALSTLANVGDNENEESYFCDTLTFAQIKDNDSILVLQGKMIVEFAELAKLGNREVEEVKSWMSTRVDEIRRPYGRMPERFPRRFIPAGTTNETYWLIDKTGNRRFWPVTCGKIDIPALTKDREQLWAEAVALYKNGHPWWIEKDSPVWKTAEVEQKKRVIDDIWYQPIEKYVSDKDFVTVREILEHFKIDVKDQNMKQQKQVCENLRKMGFKNGVKRINNITTSGWKYQEGLETKAVMPQPVEQPGHS